MSRSSSKATSHGVAAPATGNGSVLWDGVRELEGRNGQGAGGPSEETRPLPRAGGFVLSLFTAPLNTLILRALAKRPMRLAELREAAGWPPQSTLRGHLGNLLDTGAVARRSCDGKGNAIENELTALGEELLIVAAALDAWLARAPEGPLALDSEPGRAAVKALAGGWESRILRELAAGAQSLTGLDRLIEDVSYPALERRLATMRACGQIEALSRGGGRTLYAVTDWARQATAPLAVAIRCERRTTASMTRPPMHVEVETVFLLSIPLLKLSTDANGVCLAAATVNGAAGGGSRSPVGVRVEVERGGVVGCDLVLERDPPNWALGTVGAWLDAVIDGSFERLRLGGADPRLPQSLVQGAHDALFG